MIKKYLSIILIILVALLLIAAVMVWYNMKIENIEHSVQPNPVEK